MSDTEDSARHGIEKIEQYFWRHYHQKSPSRYFLHIVAATNTAFIILCLPSTLSSTSSNMFARIFGEDFPLSFAIPQTERGEFLPGIPMNPYDDDSIPIEDIPLIPLPLFAGYRSLDRTEPTRKAESAESWLTALEGQDDADSFLDKLLQDGTAKAMREEEIETARRNNAPLHPRDWSLHSLDLPLGDPFAGDDAAWLIASSNRISPERPKAVINFAVQDQLAKYEIRIRSPPRLPSDPVSPTSKHYD